MFISPYKNGLSRLLFCDDYAISCDIVCSGAKSSAICSPSMEVDNSGSVFYIPNSFTARKLTIKYLDHILSDDLADVGSPVTMCRSVLCRHSQSLGSETEE